MDFLAPEWLPALALAPLLLLVAVIARQRRKAVWQQLVASRLKQRLVTTQSSARHWISLTFSLLAFCLLLLAAARPYYGTEKTVERTKHRNLMLVLDVSRSMLCEDIQPNRLKASSALTIRLLNAFENDRIGIVAFAGGNLQIAPLTIDRNRLQTTISQLDENTIGIGGSDVTGAIRTAVEALKKTGQTSNAIIVISDGEHHEESLNEAAEFAKKAEIQVFTIGVGNEAGGTIPDAQSRDGKYRDSRGNVVHTRFHAEVLKELARLTEGQYSHIHDRPEALIKTTLESMESHQQEGQEREIANELYAWFLIPAILCIILSLLVRTRWRATSSSPAMLKSLTFILTLTAIGTENSQADFSSWFQQQKARYMDQGLHLRGAQKALENADYEACLDLLEKATETAKGETLDQVRFQRAEALFRTKQFSQARQNYALVMASESEQLADHAQYNMANSLFQQGWSQLKPPESQTFQEHIRAYYALQQSPNKDDWTEEQKTLATLPVEETISWWRDAIEHFSYSSHPRSEENQTHTQELLDIILKEKEAASPQEQQQDEKKDKEKDDQSEDSEDEQQGSDENSDESDKGEDSEEKDEKDSENQQDKEGEENSKGDKDSESDQDSKNQDSEDSQSQGEEEGKEQKNGQEDGQDQESQSQQQEESNQQANQQQNPNPSQSAAGQAAREQANQKALQALQEGLQDQTPEQQAAKILEEYSDIMKAPQARRINRPANPTPGIDW